MLEDHRIRLTSIVMGNCWPRRFKNP